MESKLTILYNGDNIWRNEKGQHHRLDGPAVIWKSGYVRWRIEGLAHRLNGPAKIWSVGYEEWSINLSVSYNPIMDNA